jgi:uncharacterized cupin superfamily protein
MQKMSETTQIFRFEPKGPSDRGLEQTSDMTADTIERGSPIELCHNYYTSPSGVLSAGVWECTPFEGKFFPYAVDEFMLILDGSVTIVHRDGFEDTFRAGDAFVIPKGLPCSWKQTESVSKYYVIFDDPAGEIPEKPVADRAIRLSPDGPEGVDLKPLTLPDTSIFEGDPPEQHDYTYFEDKTAQLYAGVWTCSPMRRKHLPFPRIELMCLLEGSMTLTEKDGTAHTFTAPDVLLETRGAITSWTSSEDVRKYYCIFEESDPSGP